MSARKEDLKINENVTVNEPQFNEKNTTKFSTDNNNFNERTNNTLNQLTKIHNEMTCFATPSQAFKDFNSE